MADLAKAQTLLDKLDSGKKVSMRDLRAALGADGVAEYENRWQAELDRRKEFEQKPDAIKKYEALVHEGDFLENRADGAKGNAAIKLRNMAQAKYERAIEYLQEIIKSDGSLRIWFDRNLGFDASTTLGLDRDSIARTITSRSAYKTGSGMAMKYSKEDIKKEILQNAIENAGRVTTAAQTEIVKRKLAALLEKRNNVE